MNHFSTDRLALALAGSLARDDEQALHRHLEECPDCGTALEQLAGGEAWSRETAEQLTADEFDTALVNQEDRSDIDFTVTHLEPSDRPDALGQLGGYDILEILGRGGMGIVLKGFDRELQRCVAIKVLSPNLALSSVARKQFTREAQAAAAVVHPHVLAIHQVQSSGPIPFLVMPLVTGESLAERLKAHGPLELKEVLRIGMQAAAGLSAAHEQGLVHRDVKPANILLEKGIDRAVLTDFGLARAGDDASLTRWGTIAGTPQYMSPEQARGVILDGRSDLFSLGCVLYEMATGSSPFRADSVVATMRRLVDEHPPAVSTLNPELPPWFATIVNRLLAKDPDRRFRTAQEVSELLEACLAHVQQPSNVPLPAVLQAPSARRLRSVFLGGLAALGLILLGGLGWQATEPPDISGEWEGDEWGTVTLKSIGEAQYTGTYTDTYGKDSGEITLKWSRIERRFNGTWREGEQRFGELSVRLVKDAIRGAFTTDDKAKINPGTPHLSDLLWERTVKSDDPNRPAPAANTGEPNPDNKLPVAYTVSDRFGNRVTNVGKKPSDDTPHRLQVHHVPFAVAKVALSADGKLLAVANGHPTTTVATESGRSRVADDWKPTVVVIDLKSMPAKAKEAGYKTVIPEGMRVATVNVDATQVQTVGTADRVDITVAPENTVVLKEVEVFSIDQVNQKEGEPKLKHLSVLVTPEQAQHLFREVQGKLVEVKHRTPRLVSLDLVDAAEVAILEKVERSPAFQVSALAFSTDGSTLAVGSTFGQVKLFDARTGKFLKSLDDVAGRKETEKDSELYAKVPRAIGSANSLAFSPDGTQLAVCGSSFAEVPVVPETTRDLGLRALATGRGRLKLWDVKAGTLQYDLAGHGAHAALVTYSPDGRLLASVGNWVDNGERAWGVKLWDPSTGTLQRPIGVRENGGPHTAAFSPDSRFLVIGSLHFDRDKDGDEGRQGVVTLVHVKSGMVDWSRHVPGPMAPLAFSADGTQILGLNGGGTLRFLFAKDANEALSLTRDTPLRWTDMAVAQSTGLIAIGGMQSDAHGDVELWSQR